MTDPLLASVVVAVRGDHRLRRLLDSLLAQSMPAGCYEVIVVENGSAEFGDVDGLGGVVRYLHLPAANAAAARNAALASARGQYLLCTDADCVAHPGWIERTVDHLAAGQVAGVGGTIEKYAPRTWVQRHAITIVDGQRALSYLPALHLPYIAGANAGFCTERLREVGGFDEALRSGSDVDICYRLGLRGYCIGLAADAVILHEDRASLVDHFLRFRRYAVYQVLLWAKYKQVSGQRWVLDGYPLRRIGGALLAAPRSGWRLAHGEPGPLLRAVLQLVEAIGVLCGQVEGAARFRQPYL